MNSLLNPAIPAGAFDSFLVTALPAARAQRSWTPADGAMPAIYLSHGAPPLFDDPAFIRQLFAWAQGHPKPTAILVISAHWESAPLTLSASAAHTPLVYDFGGFARRYYEMTYDLPEAGGLARGVASLMPDTEPLYEHRRRGLDHGAWVPLKVMYPLGDVPALQLSIPSDDPDTLLELGRRLRPLREEGVLVIGSGFMTHGLSFMTPEVLTRGAIPSWSADFDAWAAEALARGDVDTLATYRNKAPGMPYAHPTVEHFVPIFVALGAGSSPDPVITSAFDGYMLGLSKRSFAVS